MDFFSPELQNYIENHTKAESPLLSKLNRETHLKLMMPQMLSGHLQGQVLSMLSKMINPQHILEIGTFSGYSALCLAEGLRDGGMLYTIDINEELEEMVSRYIKEAGMEQKIKPMTGNALEIIPRLNLEFDLVFIDADKVNYLNYYNMVLPILKTGGYIIADNVLWSGHVLHTNPDKDTKAIKEFNDTIHSDSRVENVLLPVRDGLMLIRKVA